MDNSTVKTYVDALSAQKSQLQGYVTRGFQAIAVPASASELETRKKDFLTESGVVFLVIGIAALIFGLIIGNMGVIAAASASILSGCYVYIKGRQAMRRDAFTRLGAAIFSQIESVAAGVSAQWTSFMTRQNDALKQSVVADSTANAADKVAVIDKIDSTPAVKVDLNAVQSQIQALGADEDLDSYRSYLPKAQSAITAAIDTADGAQQTIYSTIAR